MANYGAPNVYVEDIVSGSQSITQASSSVGIMIGVTRSGVLGVAQKIGSWTEFIAKYANGLDTPFMEDSYLPYAVHGFFNNGGKELYIGSIKKNAIKATAIGATSGIVVTASNEGIWGNDLKVSITNSEDHTAEAPKFDVTVLLGSVSVAYVESVAVKDLEKTIMSNTKFKQWLSAFTLPEDTSAVVAEEIALAGGTDGDVLSDSDYTDALTMIDVLDDVTMVAIPGQTSKTVNDALLAYCDKNGLFPFLDMPMGSTTEATKAYRKSVTAWTGAVCHPWGKVNDPLTNTLKAVPTAGHVMGVYARTIQNRGIHKAPAGTDAVVRGFVEMEYALTPTQISTLNPIGVICIVAKPNSGIVLWGARSLNSTDTTMRYVTDGLLNLNIKKSLFDGTLFAVFEPNDSALWSKVRGACKGFLETLRLQGALKGTKDEAYYVIVDETNNTDSTINEGELHIEIGYAPVKPAEFVVIKLAHSIVSQ